MEEEGNSKGGGRCGMMVTLGREGDVYITREGFKSKARTNEALTKELIKFFYISIFSYTLCWVISFKDMI